MRVLVYSYGNALHLPLSVWAKVPTTKSSTDNMRIASSSSCNLTTHLTPANTTMSRTDAVHRLITRTAQGPCQLVVSARDSPKPAQNNEILTACKERGEQLRLLL